MMHTCTPYCDPPAHCALRWLRPLRSVIAGAHDPYDPAIVRATLSVIFHRNGWRVRDFALATEAGPSPWPEHTEAWLVTIEPCPDCGPPTTEPFAW